MSETKKIVTFSWLIRRAEAVFRKNPSEYRALKFQGSSHFLKGCITSMHLADNTYYNQFTLKTPQGKEYIRIHGLRHQGEHYTIYQPMFSATQYRKRMHKWLPFSLPTGVSTLGSTACVYFNANGTEAIKGKWNAGRRGRPGYHSAYALVVRDKDGAFIDYMNSPEELRNAIEQTGLRQPTDLWHEFLPGSCNSKIEWYSSMVPPAEEHYSYHNGTGNLDKVEGPLWDHKKVRLLAAKVHSEAIGIAKKYPHIKIALYPMRPVQPETDNSENQDTVSRFDELEHERQVLVLGRRADKSPILWSMPELVLYWTNKEDEARWIRVAIPPVGCNSLLRDDKDSSPHNRSARDLRYNRVPVNSGAVAERAYHALIALRQDKRGAHELRYARRLMNIKRGEADFDSACHDWNEQQNVVVVWNKSAEETFGWHHATPYVSPPTGVFAEIEERELIDSLPLC